MWRKRGGGLRHEEKERRRIGTWGERGEENRDMGTEEEDWDMWRKRG